jgi:CheY-like chemotaxis protein
VPKVIPAVLIIDDAVFSEEGQDPALFTKLRELLSQELPGYEVVLADTWNDKNRRSAASEILTLDRTGNKRIRLILLDLHFGQQDLQGDSILAEIHRITSRLVPVVILTTLTKYRPELSQEMLEILIRLGAAGWQSKDSIEQGHFEDPLREVLQRVKAKGRLRVIVRDREMLLQIVDGLDQPLFLGEGILVPSPVNTVVLKCATNSEGRVSFSEEDLLILVGGESRKAVEEMSKVTRRNKVVEGSLRSLLSKEISKFNNKLKKKGFDSDLVVGDGGKGRTAKRLSISDIDIVDSRLPKALKSGPR